MSVPPPTRPLPAPLTETVRAGTVLFRTHSAVLGGKANPGNVFNPGFGARTRWAFFGDPLVSVLYAARTEQASVFESIFHDTSPGSVVPAVSWQTKVLTALRVERDLEVAALHSAGLRRHGLHGRDLTDTPAESYSDTVAWAQAIHDDTALDGMVWMSRQFNTDQAFMFFGDRVTSDNLCPLDSHEARRDFMLPDDAEWLSALADQIDVTLMG